MDDEGRPGSRRRNSILILLKVEGVSRDTQVEGVSLGRFEILVTAMSAGLSHVRQNQGGSRLKAWRSIW